MMIFTAIPFVGLIILVYNILVASKAVMFGGGFDTMTAMLAHPLFQITALPSTTPETPWSVSLGDLIIMIAVFALAIEVVRATRTDKVSLSNHALSFVIFVIALVEFIAVKGFATSVFFILMLMSAMDVLVGAFVSIITARRDFTVGPGGLNGH